MNIRTEYILLQKWYANYQWSSEDMLSIINHEGNASQNHSKISPHNCQDGHHPINNVLERCGEILHAVSESKMVQFYRNQFLKKWKLNYHKFLNLISGI